MKHIVFEIDEISVDYLEMAPPKHFKKDICFRVHVLNIKTFDGGTWVVDHRPTKANAKRLIKKTFPISCA